MAVEQEQNISTLVASVKNDYERAPFFVRPHLAGSVALVEVMARELIALRARVQIIERDHLGL